ncbi:hypothetical protein KQI74_27515 [Paenibacillus barcinonensis]|uniref:hypothetical protein n=1 Tax=Paenibacillus barcinonensis TaxID=198119 RepID=UPI001C121C28|nr:hypothetical protein [Paenibacillus barcinonensis]MBU5356006.1 hypothetical protein [Paenibacillus barcinonensis]MDM5280120.1 hypothetical protein [Paenibacillus silvae]
MYYEIDEKAVFQGTAFFVCYQPRSHLKITHNIEGDDDHIIRDRLRVKMQYESYDFINFFDLSNR